MSAHPIKKSRRGWARRSSVHDNRHIQLPVYQRPTLAEA
jgi:hypothetical protein